MGKIVSIKRFEIHDGDGIRTTVFLKGCPLSCRWCHNPECIEARPELVYLEQKCLQCGMCEHVCPAHTMKGGKHVYKADKCSSCGKCTEICPGGALKYYGTEISAEELLEQLSKLGHEDLIKEQAIAKILGYESFENFEDLAVYPKGYRILNKVPRMPSSIVENLVKSFKSFQHILVAEISDLDNVDGIGEVRAKTIKQTLKKMQEQFAFDNILI